MARGASIGQLNQRITFQQEATASDGQGGRTSSGWSDIAATPTVWAMCRQMTGRETDEADRSGHEYPVKVMIRNRTGVDETMAILWRGRRYNIRSLEPYDARASRRMIEMDGGVVI